MDLSKIINQDKIILPPFPGFVIFLKVLCKVYAYNVGWFFDENLISVPYYLIKNNNNKT